MQTRCHEQGSVKNIDKENTNDIYIQIVQQEYTRIDEMWLQLHYKTSVILVIFSFLVEFAMGMFLVNSDMLGTTVDRFFLKFLLIPSVINFSWVVLATIIIKSKRFSQTCKIYSISLIFVCLNFVLFTVHSAFVSAYYIAAIAIMLTVIYANYYVTGITAVASIVSIIISELFIRWDLDKPGIFESTHRLSEFVITLIVLITFSMACIVVIRFERKKNRAGIQKEIERQQLQKSVYLDEMTGIYNQKAFHNELKSAEESAAGAAYILAIMDIDKFKDINDTWGHHIGDRCLIAVAKILKKYSPKITPFRYGGDEFCLLFQDISMADAEIICKEIQAKINGVVFEGYPELKPTASFGLATFLDRIDAGRLFIHADHALYEAKKARSSICVFRGEVGR